MSGKIITPDRILHEMGWAVSFSGCGALEGPKWWVVSAQPMGSICPRYIKARTPDGSTIGDAAELFVKAKDDPKREYDEKFTLEEIQKDIQKTKSRLEHLRWMEQRRLKGLDVFGIQRDPDAKKKK